MGNAVIACHFTGKKQPFGILADTAGRQPAGFNAVDVENNSGNLNVSTNSVQETIVNSSVGLIGGEIKTGIKTSPINTKSVNKATEAARKANHSKGISFTGDQARQVQKETKQYNASVKEINNVISDNANSTLGNISASISKLEEDEK